MSRDARVLIDTSAWIETLRPDGDAAVRASVAEAADYGRAVLCDMVLLELWNGAGDSREKRLLRDLEEIVPCVPTTAAVWQRARELARAGRDIGLTLPGADLLIAAAAQVHGLGLLHRDAHFDRLAEGIGE